MRQTLALLAALALIAGAACATQAQSQARLPTIEPLASATAAATPALGGKPALPPAQSAAAAAAATPAAPSPATARPQGASTAPAAGAPHTMDGTLPPTSGRWIEVDVRNYAVRLMDGATLVQEVAPVAVGEQIDTGAYASTQTGTFHVYNKQQALVYDAPYKTYISDWVGFDVQRANGFHSFLKDQHGTVVDASIGRVSNGCIRTGAAEAIYAFAVIGMPVYVHS